MICGSIGRLGENGTRLFGNIYQSPFLVVARITSLLARALCHSGFINSVPFDEELNLGKLVQLQNDIDLKLVEFECKATPAIAGC